MSITNMASIAMNATVRNTGEINWLSILIASLNLAGLYSFSAIRNLALRLRRFRVTSSDDGFFGRRFTSRMLARWPQTHT
ncbi:MAG: hypothetical protein QF376_03935, partial [Anaerolineales bacterium]|nr:hypothetical protein [Anaerolineales bacterium]